jgi:hypothetical protein
MKIKELAYRVSPYGDWDKETEPECLLMLLRHAGLSRLAIIRAAGGVAEKVDDDGYHVTYRLTLADDSGQYTTWCGRHPCYHGDESDLNRLSLAAILSLAARPGVTRLLQAIERHEELKTDSPDDYASWREMRREADAFLCTCLTSPPCSQSATESSRGR